MEAVVVVSDVFIVYLLGEDQLDDEERRQRPFALEYMDGLSRGDYRIHLPHIAIIEICGVTRAKAGMMPAIVARTRLLQWAELGFLQLHSADDDQMKAAVDLVINHNVSRRKSLSAPDAYFIALAESLDMSVITFEKYFAAAYPKTVIPA